MGPSWADRCAYLPSSFLTVVPEERLTPNTEIPSPSLPKHENVPKQTHTCGLQLLKLEDVFGKSFGFYMIFHNGPCPVRSQVCLMVLHLFLSLPVQARGLPLKRGV